MLELSPDGESVLIPALGRDAQLAVDPRREFGLDGLGTSTRSRDDPLGERPIAVDRPDLRSCRRASSDDHHSVGVVDGYVYVQSRWKPTEPPATASTRRVAHDVKGDPHVGIRT